MPVTTSNTYGKISISDEAIAKVAAHAALECYGIVEMVSRTLKDSVSQLLRRESGGKGVKVTTSGSLNSAFRFPPLRNRLKKPLNTKWNSLRV